MAEKELIGKKIYAGVYKTATRQGRSSAWDILANIIKEDGSILGDYLYCGVCCSILRYHNNQTSNLLRHKCVREAANRKASRGLSEERISLDLADTAPASHIEQFDDTSQPTDTNDETNASTNTTCHINQSQLEDVSQPTGDPIEIKIENCDTISSSEYDTPHMAASVRPQPRGRPSDRCAVFGELIAEHLRNLLPRDSIALESRLSHTLYAFLTETANKRIKRK